MDTSVPNICHINQISRYSFHLFYRSIRVIRYAPLKNFYQYLFIPLKLFNISSSFLLDRECESTAKFFNDTISRENQKEEFSAEFRYDLCSRVSLAGRDRKQQRLKRSGNRRT